MNSIYLQEASTDHRASVCLPWIQVSRVQCQQNLQERFNPTPQTHPFTASPPLHKSGLDLESVCSAGSTSGCILFWHPSCLFLPRCLRSSENPIQPLPRDPLYSLEFDKEQVFGFVLFACFLRQSLTGLGLTMWKRLVLNSQRSPASAS